jgi:hypothetical protein
MSGLESPETLGLSRQGVSNLKSQNQDYALARFREDGAAGDPELYTKQVRHGRLFVWLNIAGNTGWSEPVFSEHEGLTGLKPEGMPVSYQWKLVSPKQRRKIEHLLRQ